MKYQKIVNNKVTCLICPRECSLNNGQYGFCHVRKNENNKIISTTYGYNTGLSIDPVEKKPLYHFYPSTGVLSFGTLGCSMGCRFCQNYHITKTKDNPQKYNHSTPEEIVETAKKYKVKSVAFTYNDPIVFFEYAIDTAKLLRQEGIKTIAVTSGFMNIEPAKEFYKYMDAANIDLKGFSEDFYAKNCYAKLAPVLEVIKYAKNETDCHIELTTLLIEGENTDPDELKKESQWILTHTGDTTPLHFSAFTPKYKFSDKTRTSIDTLLSAREIALAEGIKYVYTGNIINVETSSTYCKNCHNAIIERDGYRILNYHLENGSCKYCHTSLDGVFE